MRYVKYALELAPAPDDAHVAIEYQIPQSSKRVDFLISGTDYDDRESLVIVELKQWETVQSTTKDAIVRSFVGGGIRDLTHPSYQAWTYAALIEDYNVAVQTGDIALHPCAYLHNCRDEGILNATFYEEHTRRAPVFLKEDVEQLASFLARHVRHGDRNKTLYRIENSRIQPSKELADHLAALIKGNQEFLMIDDQKVVYETALEAAASASSGQKHVLLVEGGPGTGKSVVAINLLVELTTRGKTAQYVTRNAAPRAVYEAKLAGTLTKTRITNLFKNSGAYVGSLANEIDCLIVDEAHRLNEKSGLFQNQGTNQIAEIINAAQTSVFFLDQDQRVTIKDIGDREEIQRHALAAGAQFTTLKLASQFRCNGSDGYLAWINNTLQVEDTANKTLTGVDYDFRVLDDPNELRQLIEDHNTTSTKARMLAGYCWDWKGKKNPNVVDVQIPEYGFEMKWNLDQDGPLWILSPDSVSEIGCIHTCQGLELDYVGVIIGRDLMVRGDAVVTDAAERSSQDRSIHGYKKLLSENPPRAKEAADRIIKNTYRTLMTRGQKGCYVFCVDEETNTYFKRASDRSA
ncbi:MAG: DUF2075 domain-containing protein [Gammaproteobacteria bacterium]|nr:DUF2075 domain-containing protein [Gammaproteobacteria bacterium]